jgi:hypothetical protein
MNPAKDSNNGLELGNIGNKRTNVKFREFKP